MVGERRRGQKTVLLVKKFWLFVLHATFIPGSFCLSGPSISTATTLSQRKSSTSRTSLVAADANLDYASADFTN
jgi:hypothetical protein